MTEPADLERRLSASLSGASIERVSSAVRAEILCRGTKETRVVLDALGLHGRDALDPAASQIYDAAYVDRDEARLRDLCRGIHLAQPEAQVLLQALQGRSPIAFSGLLHLLARHRLVSVDEPGVLRRYLATLNEVGLVVWSRKEQAVRVGSAGISTEASPRIRVVQPDRPYTNVMHLRQLIRGCDEFIWWAEVHLNHKALEPLAVEAEPGKVSEIRLLSGPAAIDRTTLRDWRRFKREMEERGIVSEWRVLPRYDIPFHDRYLIGRDEAWNLPPVNSLYKGSYAEATRCETRPPFQDWWARAAPLEQRTEADVA